MGFLTIIDHSLCDEGSHHAAYAWSVAEAARGAGCHSLIAANRNFAGQHLQRPDLEVRSVFRGSIYGNGSLLAGLDRGGRWNLDAGHRRKARLSPGRLLRQISARSPCQIWNRAALRFAVDCESLFENRVMNAGDRVLVATASEVELYGLCRFLANHPQTLLASWNLLFHFNLFHGRPPDYAGQLQRLRLARDRFCDALRLVPYHQLRFFTTTETLADQYNRMGLVRFGELAWPIAGAFRPDEPGPRRESAGDSDTLGRSGSGEACSTAGSPRRPLRIVMPGTVRREKGQSRCLQKVMELLGPTHLETGRLQFVVQAPRRPWYQRKKLRLGGRSASHEDRPDRPVVVWPHPLPAPAYSQLIESTDIGLLMYDRESYYARRAGVLCELLSRGRPVIVTAGTWLGDELEEYRNDRAQALASGPLALRTLGRDALEFSSQNLPHPGGVLTFDDDQHPIEFAFDRAPHEAGVVVRFQWHHPVGAGTYCRIEQTEGGRGPQFSLVAGHRRYNHPVSVFLRLPEGTGRCHLRLTNAFHQASANIQNLSVTTLDSRAAELPLSQVGLAIDRLEDLPAAICEMEQHYAHYRRTAAAWAGEWYDRQNADRTVGQLLGSGGGAAAGKAA